MVAMVKPTGINSVWAAGGTRVNPGASKVNLGWVVQLPPYEYQNWVDWRQDSFIAHANQYGIPEWDSETEYQADQSYTKGSNGIVYICRATHTNRNPVVAGNIIPNGPYWQIAFETAGAAAVVQTALNTHLTNYQSLSGVTNVGAARNNLSVYSRSESDSRYASLVGNSGISFNVNTATAATHAVPLWQVSSLMVPATESGNGVVTLASAVEVQTGTNTTKAVTPAGAATVYMKKSDNLAGLANVATARANLGIQTAGLRATEWFLQAGNNLSDIPNMVAARSNLGITSTALQPETYFLRSGQNLADLPSKAAARSNLGLTDLSTVPTTDVMFKADNLAGLTNIGQARINLGLGSMATQDANAFMVRSNNLADLTSTQTARNNLGLGPLATMAAAFTGAPPGTLDFTNSLGPNGWQKLPGGLILQWGTTTAQNYYNVGFPQYVSLPMAFPNRTAFATFSVMGENSYAVEIWAMDWTRTTNSALAFYSNYIGEIRWFALGY